MIELQINTRPSLQEKFLSNEYNKTQFVSFISRFLLNDGQNVNNCESDADTKIVQVAVNASLKTTKLMVVVAGDIDIAIMLLHH